MKFKSFLISFSLLICSSISADFSYKNTFVEWNSGRLQVQPNNINIFTKDENTAAFLTIDVSKKKIDLKNENVLFDLLIDDIRSVNGVEIRLSESRNSDNYYHYALPFFTDYEFNLIKSSSKTPLSLSGANLKLKGPSLNKINFITVYFSAKSKESRLSISNLKTSKKSSDGVLTITFDDGANDNLLAAKILKPYNIPVTAYIMPNALNTKNYLTPKELSFLSTQNWDIDAHHETPFTYFEKMSLYKEIDKTLDFFKKNKYKSSEYHLAYPLGKTNSETYQVIKEKFSTARIASGGIETLPPADLHMLRAFNVLSTTSPEELKDVIQKAKDNKQWLILMFHHIKEKAVDDIDYSTENFKKVAKIISESQIDILTMDQVWNKYLK